MPATTGSRGTQRGDPVSLSYEIDSQLGILRIRVDGSPDASEDAELTMKWANDPLYRPGMPILVDNRKRTSIASSAHIADMAEQTARSKLLQVPTRCAVVVARDAQFGMTRMFALRSADTKLETRVFRDIQEAEQWLTSQPDP